MIEDTLFESTKEGAPWITFCFTEQERGTVPETSQNPSFFSSHPSHPYILVHVLPIFRQHRQDGMLCGKIHICVYVRGRRLYAVPCRAGAARQMLAVVIPPHTYHIRLSDA